ncbi:hypothetical protein MYAM1_003887 [Malassezia yamatoensis]|uniref:Selenoprotein O n=1 Tax=Malassezia yamatoensis TaxID=253288 RepID=A0AAJ6CJB0_9BASI|nr:hypothetical protein MYAM1_003887 [Malassezia yamatoensis]
MKYRPLSLPRVPVAQQVTANLLADPVTPTAAALVAVPVGYPSLLRRARFVQNGAHFSYVSPLPLLFPYEFPAQNDQNGDQKTLGEQQKSEIQAEQEQNFDLNEAQREERSKANAVRRMDQIEDILREYEVAIPAPGQRIDPVPPRRRGSGCPSARVVAFSPECHAQCLPHLAVGDVHAWLLANTGKEGPDTYSSGPIADAIAGGVPSQYGEEAGDDHEARRAFSDWAAGRAVPLHITSDQIYPESGPGVQFFNEADANEGWKKPAEETPERYSTEVAKRVSDDKRAYGPYSLRYGGHQFGEWAGQLGDGRAVTLVEAWDTESQQRWEVQLKGAGRTPFSRFGDGLATLKSSLREFLASEYMAALQIPTSRSLAVTSLPDLPVARESLTSAAIAMRITPSWLRIGNFQIHSKRQEWESVRLLGEFVAHDLLHLDGVKKSSGSSVDHGLATDSTDSKNDGKPWSERLIREVAQRNARTCALWQAYGFMHGVLNTDNICLLGETIDYGPYGFMDVFDDAQICNHSDYSGRYSYRMQPTMILYAIDQLLESLAPVLGFEDIHQRAPRPGELLLADDSQRAMWADHGMDTLAESIRDQLKNTLLSEWANAWLLRLGVQSRGASQDKSQLIDPLVDLLTGLDMTNALRYLCDFPTSDKTVSSFAKDWVDYAARDSVSEQKVQSAEAWLHEYEQWLRASPQSAEDIASHMRQVGGLPTNHI